MSEVLTYNEIPSVRMVNTRSGDTLQRISLRELGDASFWVLLAEINELVPPYIAETASSGVLAFGDSIKIPAPSTGISSTTDTDKVFDTDLSLASGLLAAVDGDFLLVSGVPNLKQAMKMRIDVEKRELIFHPEYGSWLRAILGASNGPGTAALAAFYVKSSLLEDDRIKSIDSCTAEVDGDAIRVRAVVVPISGRQIEIIQEV